jgi:hypothetical protein
MIKVSDVYDDLKSTTKEVVDFFSLNGTRLDPSLIVGIANMVCILRHLERYKISDAAQEALTRLVRTDKAKGELADLILAALNDSQSDEQDKLDSVERLANEALR